MGFGWTNNHYPEIDEPKFQKHYEDITQLLELEATNPDEYWSKIKARYRPEVERWREWDRIEGAKQRAYAAEIEAAKAAWMNSTAEWREAHRAGYYDKWGEFRVRVWDIEIASNKRHEARKAEYAGLSEEEIMRRIREEFIRDQARFYNSITMPTGDLQAALKRLGLGSGPDEAEARRAYRRLAMKVHPDVGGSHDDFVQLQQDYETVLASCAI